MIKMRPASLSLPKHSPRVIGRTTQGRSPCSKEVQGGSEGNRRGHRQRQDSIEHREPEQRARWGNIQAKPWKVPACLDRAQAEEGEWKCKKSTATGREEEWRGWVGQKLHRMSKATEESCRAYGFRAQAVRGRGEKSCQQTSVSCTAIQIKYIGWLSKSGCRLPSVGEGAKLKTGINPKDLR